MEHYFHQLADFAQTQARGREIVTLWLAAEDSDFLRFNRSRVRQAIHVRQAMLTLTLIDGARRLSTHASLAGEFAADRALIEHTLAAMRRDLPALPEDPYLLIATEPVSGTHRAPGRIPVVAQVIEQVLAAGEARDLVGFYAGGPVMRGFANSLSQRNWYEASSFDLTWSLYVGADKAVQSRYAGNQWDDAALASRAAEAGAKAALLTRAPRKLAPGRYRAWFSPAAMSEFLGALAWGGFSLKSLRSKHSALGRLYEGAAQLSPLVSMSEDTANGLAPAFQQDGFVKPDRVPLIERGAAAQALVSPRSAREYDVQGNGASGDEMPNALSLAAGTLADEDVLRELGTGLLIGNLWYLNYSDRQACRLTGMTRFASFWVENGEIVAPLEVMRFDDSLYRLLGPQLVALGAHAELLPDGATWGERATGSQRTPGALVEDFILTL